jgi:outer membrane protein OmpA-like peptidoglycan-associated protein
MKAMMQTFCLPDHQVFSIQNEESQFVENIVPTEHTPRVRFFKQKNLMWISGKSDHPGRPDALMEAIRMTERHLQTSDHLHFVFDITQVNASSVKALMNLLNQLKNHFQKGKDIRINWMISYLDDDMMYLALGMLQLFRLKIEIKPY